MTKPLLFANLEHAAPRGVDASAGGLGKNPYGSAKNAEATPVATPRFAHSCGLGDAPQS